MRLKITFYSVYDLDLASLKKSSPEFFSHVFRDIPQILSDYIAGNYYKISLPKNFNYKEILRKHDEAKKIPEKQIDRIPFKTITTITINDEDLIRFIKQLRPRYRNQFFKQLLRHYLGLNPLDFYYRDYEVKDEPAVVRTKRTKESDSVPNELPRKQEYEKEFVVAQEELPVVNWQEDEIKNEVLVQSEVSIQKETTTQNEDSQEEITSYSATNINANEISGKGDDSFDLVGAFLDINAQLFNSQ